VSDIPKTLADFSDTAPTATTWNIRVILASIALFFSAFVAATILPAQSEAVLVYNLTQYPNQVIWFVTVASVGNILGSVINWLLGRFLLRFQQHRWFPASPEKLAQAQNTYRRYGRYSLLLSWVPIIGDPITVVAGIMREPILRFVIWVSIAKAGRYIVIAAVMTQMA